MADTIVSRVVFQNPKRLVVRAEIQSDGTGTTDGVLVQKSLFTGPNGLQPSKFCVEKIDYIIDGMQVTLKFNHTASDLLINLGGNTDNSGTIDFTNDGEFYGFVDPASAGGTGDITGTTTGHSPSDKAAFVFYLKKKD